MDVAPESTLLNDLKAENLIEYIELTGWSRVKEDNPRWLVYAGPDDAQGNPLEIVLPKDQQVSDMQIYIASSVNLLSALTDTDPEFTIRKVKLYDTDVLDIRNLETGKRDSITLQLAAQQIQEIKRLIAYSARSEYDPKPHYRGYDLALVRRMINHYQFGHTKQGSFIFTIESRIIRKPTSYTQLRLLKNDEDKIDIEPRPPIERRIMERVIRGLLATKKAVAEKNLEILIDAYPYGFNSRMCDAITRMTLDQSAPIEYKVVWSPKIEPSSDLESIEPIALNSTNYLYLKDAAKALKQVTPQKTTIRGMVKGLVSDGAPLGDEDIQRSVIIKWTNRPQGARPVNIQVSLNKQSYALAHKAHLDWIPIYVTGYLQETAGIKRLGSPENFRLAE